MLEKNYELGTILVERQGSKDDIISFFQITKKNHDKFTLKHLDTKMVNIENPREIIIVPVKDRFVSNFETVVSKNTLRSFKEYEKLRTYFIDYKDRATFELFTGEKSLA